MTPITILLIDHETYRIQSLSRGLRIAGHQVLEAETLQQALGQISKEPSRIDVIITDASTRILSKSELLQTLHMKFPNIQVVVTTDLRPGDEGGEDFPWPVHNLVKPFTEVELRRLVESLCRCTKGSYTQSVEARRSGHRSSGSGVNQDEGD